MRLPDGSFRLVKTYSRRKALSHIADSVFIVSVATDDDLMKARQDLVAIECPGEQELIDASESPAN